MEELVGHQFGPYRVVAALGEGGMAAVYKAFQPAVNRYVALKILSRSFTKDPQFLQRFRHEGRILAQLQHPHILPIFDFGESDGYAFLAMPFINGGTLSGRLRGQPLSLAVAERAMQQICDALNYAHSKGIVHRDIKPSNVLLDEGDNCLLADFGIARLTEGATRLTHTGMLMGTPEYMSPEQASGETVGPASDIYSVGILLYELVTGRVPFKAETPVAVAIKHLTAPLPPPRTINPALMPEVEGVVLKALARLPADRFSSPANLAAALSDAIQSAQLNQEIPTIVGPKHTTIERDDSTPIEALRGTRQSTLRVDLIGPAQNANTNVGTDTNTPEGTGATISNVRWNWKPIAISTAAAVFIAIAAGGMWYQSRSRPADAAAVPIDPVGSQPQSTGGSPQAPAIDARADPPLATMPPPKSAVPELPKPSPQVSARTPAPANNPPAPAAQMQPAKGALLVMCDRDCTVSVDAEPSGATTAGRGLTIPAGLGQHLVKATQGTATWEQVVEVPSTGQIVVRTNLAGEIERIETAAREAAEQARRREQAEQAERDRLATAAEQERQERDRLARMAESRRQQQQATEAYEARRAQAARERAALLASGRIVATKTTNENGRYSVGLPGGNCTVEFSLDGFKTYRYELSGSGGGTINLVMEISFAGDDFVTITSHRGSGGSVRGTVTDRLGAPLPGVTVIVFKR